MPGCITASAYLRASAVTRPNTVRRCFVWKSTWTGCSTQLTSWASAICRGIAKTESQRAGFDEAIMLDPQGFVAECTGENIFVVRRNIIYTVPRGAILEGITRDTLITLARDSGYEVVEEPISRDQLYIADEVFVCGTAAEVIALREIDFRTIGTGKAGPITRALQQAFDEVTSGGHARSAEWLSYVPAFDAAVA